MFFFGNPDDNADLLVEEAKRTKGPNAPEVPLEEMEESDLRIAFTYLYMAVVQANRDMVAEDVFVALLTKYDHVFSLLAERSDTFKATVDQGKHMWVLGHTKENIEKYRKLAGLSASAS